MSHQVAITVSTNMYLFVCQGVYNWIVNDYTYERIIKNIYEFVIVFIYVDLLILITLSVNCLKQES